MCENCVLVLPVNILTRCDALASLAARHTTVCLELKNSHSCCKKGAAKSGSSTKDGQGEKVNFVLIPSEAGMRTQIDLNCVMKNFYHGVIITAISWPPPGFYNFFTLAIFCTAARLGCTLFHSLNGCFFLK